MSLSHETFSLSNLISWLNVLTTLGWGGLKSRCIAYTISHVSPRHMTSTGGLCDAHAIKQQRRKENLHHPGMPHKFIAMKGRAGFSISLNFAKLPPIWRFGSGDPLKHL